MRNFQSSFYEGSELDIMYIYLILSPSFPPVVLRIRQAPSPSSFVLREDLDLRQQVLHVLRRRERKNEGRGRKERISSTGSEGTVAATDTTAGKVRRKSSPSYVTTGTGSAPEETGRKKKQLDK